MVVLDPPRTGAKRAVAGIAALTPRSVVYVACDPAALARDLATFADLGYRLDRLRAFALFPMTHHVECVATLVPHSVLHHVLMGFADASVCPSCRGQIEQATRARTAGSS